MKNLRPSGIVYADRIFSIFGFHLYRLTFQDRYGKFSSYTLVHGSWAGFEGKVCRIVQPGGEDNFVQWWGSGSEIGSLRIPLFEESAANLEKFNKKFAV